MRHWSAITISGAVALLLAAGCNLVGPNRNYDAELAHYKQLAQTVEHAELNTPPSEHAFSPEPRTITHNPAPLEPHEWWEMTVDEAIQLAVSRSSVLRDLGGTIVRTPESMRTILNPAVVASDARFGMEAALSEFDATLASSVITEKNDRMTNNSISAGGTRFFQQDLITFQSQVSKLGAAGTRMTLRGSSVYDDNSASFNTFRSNWDTLVEAEIRQPLWQGAGTRFNRLAGPNAVPGFYNGVLIARVNTDISVADFEIGLRDLVSNVENAYWDLYFAYRDLDAKIQARNAALDAWKRTKILLEHEQGSGQLEREAQAREQYFRYEEEVQNALAGTLQSATTNNNGASGGSFRGVGGVLVSERRLRLAIGLPITDGRLIRPADEPTLARVEFEWSSASDDAIARRPELLRQRHVIKRREMEYVAARNFLLPRFDVFGKYRVRGMGEDLIGDATSFLTPVIPPGPFANSSLANLASGNFQEWQLGGEVSLPIGFRRGWAAVRNAQLNLARDKAILEEQERQVIHDLSNAVGDMQRAYQIMETTYNRRLAAQQNVDILRFRLEKGQPVSPEQLLEGERRLSDSDIQYNRALVEHMLAIKNVHFEKGTLLLYGRIQLAEQLPPSGSGPAPTQPAPAQTPTPAASPPPTPLPTPLPPPSGGQAPAPLLPPAPPPQPPLPNFPALGQPASLPPANEVFVLPPASAPAAPPPAFPSPTSVLPPPQSVLQPPQSVLPPPQSVLQPPQSVLQPPQSVLQPPRNYGLPPRDPLSNWTPPAPAPPPQAGGEASRPMPVVTVSPSTGLIERTWFLKEPAPKPVGAADMAIPTFAPARSAAQTAWTPPPAAGQLPLPAPLMRLPPPEAEPRAENALQRLPSP